MGFIRKTICFFLDHKWFKNFERYSRTVWHCDRCGKIKTEWTGNYD